MSNCSIALQVLPLYGQPETSIQVADAVIAYIAEQTNNYEVSAFETTIVGDFDECMRILKGAIEVAGEAFPTVFTNVKINYNTGGEVLTIEEKVAKHKH